MEPTFSGAQRGLHYSGRPFLFCAPSSCWPQTNSPMELGAPKQEKYMRWHLVALWNPAGTTLSFSHLQSQTEKSWLFPHKRKEQSNWPSKRHLGFSERLSRNSRSQRSNEKCLSDLLFPKLTPKPALLPSNNQKKYIKYTSKSCLNLQGVLFWL